MSVTYQGLRRVGLSHALAQRALLAGQQEAVRVHIANGDYDAATKDLAKLLLSVSDAYLSEPVTESDVEPAAPPESPHISPGATSLG